MIAVNSAALTWICGPGSVRRFGAKRAGGRAFMFGVRDLFQWERFITPSIIRAFFWLAFVVALIGGIYGVLLGLQELPLNPLAAFLITLGSIAGALFAILTARIVAEFVLITFRINDHLGTLRSRTEA
jgi:hypothetical protein